MFEDEALSWDERLNKINGIFDVWIDVQRRWVYLEGIFTGSADIKHLLPNETQRFQSISAEFLGLMKKVAKSPLVIDVINIPGVLKSLERLADLLAKIQKALGEYLERERSSFPRFYFVGDEDLLEIIGNSKNIQKLQKHFKKMFAGVATLILTEDSQTVVGLCSKEGEEVIDHTLNSSPCFSYLYNTFSGPFCNTSFHNREPQDQPMALLSRERDEDYPGHTTSQGC